MVTAWIIKLAKIAEMHGLQCIIEEFLVPNGRSQALGQRKGDRGKEEVEEGQRQWLLTIS